MSSPKRAGDYRVFVGAFPTGELADRIQALRKEYDPVTARITPPHVTLAGTYWRSGEPTVENEAETIRRLEILHGLLPPFSLHLGGVRSFPGDRPVVYLDVKVNQPLIEARNLLLSMMGSDKHKTYTPHLTLAMRLAWDDAWSMITGLQGSEWNTQTYDVPINELRFMQRGPQDKAWRCIYTLPLTTG